MSYRDDSAADDRQAVARLRPAPADEPLSVADRIDPLRFFDLPETAGEVAAAVMRRLDAGTALVFALHDAGPDVVVRLPDEVRRAYARCCAVYRPEP